MHCAHICVPMCTRCVPVCEQVGMHCAGIFVTHEFALHVHMCVYTRDACTLVCTRALRTYVCLHVCTYIARI